MKLHFLIFQNVYIADFRGFSSAVGILLHVYKVILDAYLPIATKFLVEGTNNVLRITLLAKLLDYFLPFPSALICIWQSALLNHSTQKKAVKLSYNVLILIKNLKILYFFNIHDK